MSPPPEIVEFRDDDRSAVIVRMDDLKGRGRGWITFQPGVDPDDAPPPRGLFSIFSGRGPLVPVCSWVTGERTGSVEHISLGVQHATGPKVVALLEEHGLPVPKDWQALTDHPRRGLVVAVPLTASNDDVLAWLLAAGAAVTRVPLTGMWQATIYTG